MTANVRPDHLERLVREALTSVRDPELDESITSLEFVSGVEVEEGAIRVRLRLPTYFCAPNFAYLMVADAHDAVSAVAGGRAVTIRLEDHFASDEINGGVSDGAGFQGAFPGQAQDDLEELRHTFRRKAHAACLERASAQLIKRGWQIEGLPEAHLSDLPATPERDSLLRRRADLGLSNDPGEPMYVDSSGSRIPGPDLAAHLRMARATRVSIDGNASLCRGLLRTRYGDQQTLGTLSAVSTGRSDQ